MRILHRWQLRTFWPSLGPLERSHPAIYQICVNRQLLSAA